MTGKDFKILSTGILSEEFISKASGYGIHIDVIPFYRITRFSDPETGKIIQDLSARNKTVIFTSRHAAHTVISYLDTVPDWQIYCLNGATKKAVTSFWDCNTVLGEANNGKELALHIIGSQRKEDIVFFCGEQRLDTLPHLLAAGRIPLKEVVVYTTTPTPRPITGRYDGILFFNPIGVHSFFSCNKTAHEILFSIGETTSAAISSHVNNPRDILTVDQPCKELMVEKVIHTFKSKSYGK